MRDGPDHRRRRPVRPRPRCSTTVGALLDGEPIAAKPCQTDPIRLPAGQQELVISPGPAFVVDGVQLAGPLAGDIAQCATPTPVRTEAGPADRREVDVPASDAARVLVVPESINPGWTAHTADGAALTPVTVNGWQQGWVVPAGAVGAHHARVRLEHAVPHRAVRRPRAAAGARPSGVLRVAGRNRTPEPAEPWQPRPSAAGVTVAGIRLRRLRTGRGGGRRRGALGCARCGPGLRCPSE